VRLPRWLGGDQGEDLEVKKAETAFDIKESEQEREQIWREKIEMDARIKSLREIAEFLGRVQPR
jgi:hypothetical protein